VASSLEPDADQRLSGADLLKKLDFEDRLSRQNQIDGTQTTPESFRWVLDHDFGKWLRSSDSGQLFWVSGKPGSGKSTLINWVLRNNPFSSGWLQVGFFFDFRAKTGIRNNFEGFLRSVLCRLVEKFSSFASTLQRSPEFSTSYDRAGQWVGSLLMLKRALVEGLKTALEAQPGGGLMLFVDGLDEYGGDKNELVDFVEDLVASGAEARNFKICLSCRPDPPFSTRLLNYPQLSMQQHNREGI
jgi:hypothetical protein